VPPLLLLPSWTCGEGHEHRGPMVREEEQMAEPGSSAPDSAPQAETGRGVTARRIVLGTQLRRLREAAGISRADAGYVIRASDSKVSRLELGRVAFKERDVA